MRMRCLRVGAPRQPSSFCALLSTLLDVPSPSRLPPPDFLAPTLHRPLPPPNRRHRILSRSYAAQSCRRQAAESLACQADVFDSYSEQLHAREPPPPTKPPAKPSASNILDDYLPVELRRGNSLHDEGTRKRQRRNPSLPQAVRAAEASLPQPPLSYLALEEGQWDAFLWLVKELTKCQQTSELVSPEILHHSPLWESFGSMSTLTDAPIVLSSSKAKQDLVQSSLDRMVPGKLETAEKVLRDERLNPMGIIWESLGYIVLDAACETDASKCSLKLSYVREAIAHLHSINAVSKLLYEFDSDDTLAATRKPPLLSLLQSRILVSLTDSAWNASKSETRNGKAGGAESSPPSQIWDVQDDWYKPDVNPLRPELWLELILWSCVHDGHFAAALGLVSRIARASNTPWHSVSWQEIESSVTDKPDKLSSWLLRLAGTAEGYESSPPVITSPEHAVSREVVTSAFEGILNDFQRHGAARASIQQLWDAWAVCKDLSAVGSSIEDWMYWNSIIMRITDASRHKLRVEPRILTLAFDIARTFQEIALDTEISGDEQSWLADMEFNHAPPLSSILSWSLDGFFARKQIDGAMQLCREWRQTVDAFKERSFENENDEGLDSQAPTIEPHDNTDDIDPPAFADIPPLTIAALLSVLSGARFQLKDPDIEGILALTGGLEEDSQVWANPSLWPPLLRFANATSNVDLLDNIYDKINNLDTPPSTAILLELLHCQISYGEWERVRSLFAALAQTPNARVDVTHICMVARKIMLTEAEEPHSPSVKEGTGLLQALLSGAYTVSAVHLGPRGVGFTLLRKQLARILWRTFGQCAKAGQRVYQLDRRAPTVIFPADAFNILLEAVATAKGSQPAKVLFDRWCFTPDMPAKDASRTRESVERAAKCCERPVLPDLQTVRILLAPAEAELCAFFEVEEAGGAPPVEDRLPWRAFAAGAEVDLAQFRLPEGAPHRELIEWGWSMYQLLSRETLWFQGSERSGERPDERPSLDFSLQVREPVREGSRPLISYE